MVRHFGELPARGQVRPALNDGNQITGQRRQPRASTCPLSTVSRRLRLSSDASFRSARFCHR